LNTQILIAGVGNIFLSDDGFGPEAVRALAREPLPTHARAVDYGIRGLHLAYDLLEGYHALVLVDALPGDHGPGTVRVLEVGRADLPPSAGVDAHGMDPAAVLATVESLGGRLPRTFVVGCEPASTGEGIGLSEAVTASMGTATAAVQDLLAHELAAPPVPSPRSAGREL